jgi:hypothetical protein
VVVCRENSEHGENGEDTRGLDWFRPPESKTLRPACGGIRRGWGSPLEWSSRPPYMASRLGLPFKVGGPSSGSITDQKGHLLRLQGGSRDPRTYWRRRTAIYGRSLRHKPSGSSVIWMRLPEVLQGLRGRG